ncbi:unnamed protein product [Moneuplotes crassus]|uniref:Uncharacterized protein n=1 Tax=Euplotes crassus TaxID=5936 RepID=A0AAD1Y3C7_EUPCR|nr:unnamed protein product [Moneuplotes crassus]
MNSYDQIRQLGYRHPVQYQTDTTMGSVKMVPQRTEDSQNPVRPVVSNFQRSFSTNALPSCIPEGYCAEQSPSEIFGENLSGFRPMARKSHTKKQRQTSLDNHFVPYQYSEEVSIQNLKVSAYPSTMYQPYHYSRKSDLSQEKYANKERASVMVPAGYSLQDLQENKRSSSISSKYSIQDLAEYRHQARQIEARTNKRIEAVVRIQRAFRRYLNRLREVGRFYKILNEFKNLVNKASYYQKRIFLKNLKSAADDYQYNCKVKSYLGSLAVKIQRKWRQCQKSKVYKEKIQKKCSKLLSESFTLCRKMVQGMKMRKILKLKHILLQKNLILDVQRALEGSNEAKENYQKDLKQRKIKYINTINKYFETNNWNWLSQGKVKDAPRQSSFNPSYQESKKMTRLMTCQDQSINQIRSETRRLNTWNDEGNALNSERSMSSSTFDRAMNSSTFDKRLGSSKHERATISSIEADVCINTISIPPTSSGVKPHLRNRVDMYRTSAENPLADTLSHTNIKEIDQKYCRNPYSRQMLTSRAKNIPKTQINYIQRLQTQNERGHRATVGKRLTRNSTNICPPFIQAQSSSTLNRENYDTLNTQYTKNVQPRQNFRPDKQRGMWKSNRKKTQIVGNPRKKIGFHSKRTITQNQLNSNSPVKTFEKVIVYNQNEENLDRRAFEQLRTRRQRLYQGGETGAHQGEYSSPISHYHRNQY